MKSPTHQCPKCGTQVHLCVPGTVDHWCRKQGKRLLPVPPVQKETSK